MIDYNTSYQDNNYLKEYNTKAVRKGCNKMGLMLIATTVVTTVVAIVLQFFIYYSSMYDPTKNTGIFGIPYSLYYLMNAMCEFMGFFIVPLLFCLIFKFKLNVALPFNRDKKDNMFLLIIAGYAICTISNFAVSILNENLSLFSYENTTGVTLGADTIQDKILYFICIAIVPAITEEFCFRGVLLNYLRKYGDYFAVLVSSILFGLVHGNFVQMPFAFIVGLVCGFLVIHTNSMLPAIILHLLNNGISVIEDIVSSLTNNTVSNIFSTAVLFILTLAGFIAIIILAKRGISLKAKNQYKEINNMKTSLKIKAFLTNPGSIIFLSIYLLDAVGILNV